MTSCHSSPPCSSPPSLPPFQKKPTLDSADIQNYRPASLLSFLSKMCLECAVYNQLSSCLSENDLLDPNQSGFRTARSTETGLLIGTESLCVARASSYSSVVILLDLSSAVDHQILLSTLAEHRWLCSNLIHIIPDKSHLSGHMEWLLVQTLFCGHWCPSRLSTRTASVFTIHKITRLCSHITWILWPMLRWRHPAVPLFPCILLQQPHCETHLFFLFFFFF